MEEKKRARMNKKNKHTDQGFEVVIDLPTEYQIWQYNHVPFLWRLLKVRERKRERETWQGTKREEFGNILIRPANKLIETWREEDSRKTNSFSLIASEQESFS